MSRKQEPIQVDIKHAEVVIERFYKTTTILAEKISGVGTGGLSFYPVIHGEGAKIGLYFKGSKGGDTLADPYVVNAAFSLELLLKAIIYYETNIWTSGHKLHVLYEKISDESKAKADAIFNEIYKSRAQYKEITSEVKKSFNIEIKWRLYYVLKDASNAFVQIRYIFERGNSYVNFRAYGEVFEALSDVKEELRKKHYGET